MHFRKRLGTGLFGGEGFIMQKITGPGLVFLEVDGEVVEYQLQAGQQLKVDTGHLAAMEASVEFDVTMVKGFKNILLGGEGLFLASVRGPGKVWLQTMPMSKLARKVAQFMPQAGGKGSSGGLNVNVGQPAGRRLVGEPFRPARGGLRPGRGPHYRRGCLAQDGGSCQVRSQARAPGGQAGRLWARGKPRGRAKGHSKLKENDMDQTEQLLKEITEASGVPGYESDVRAVMRRYLEGIATIEQDKMGSFIGKHVGQADGPRVMLAGHMDEIGFMVKLITKEGFIRFVPLGGWWNQVMLGHRVTIKTAKGDVIGVLGAKPPHLLGDEERKKIVDKKDMYIDVGARSEEEVRDMGVRPGDPIIPVSDFTVMANPRFYLSKAFDNRVGCALAMQALAPGGRRGPSQRGLCRGHGPGRGRAPRSQDVSLCHQPRRGHHPGGRHRRRRAGHQARGVGRQDGRRPDAAGVRCAHDPQPEAARPGDRHRRRSWASRSSSRPCQAGQPTAAMIHIHNEGVPAVVIGVPTRHIHSHNAILCRDDYDQALQLVVALVKKLDAATVAGLTA